MAMHFPGLSIGHVSKPDIGTGISVLLLDKLTSCVALTLGAAPATYELGLLAPDALVGAVDAVVLAGGSSLGLDAIAGVKTWLLEQGRGFPTDICPVPIVTGAAIFDLHRNPPDYPTAADAYLACQLANTHASQGRVGAGTGATVGKMLPHTVPSQGGFGAASLALPSGVRVFAVAVVNAAGDIYDNQGQWLAGARDKQGHPVAIRTALLQGQSSASPLRPGQHTTLVAVFTNAKVDRATLSRLAKAASTGMAQAIMPVFTCHDGDILFALTTEVVEADELQLGVLMAEAVRQAIVNAVKPR